MPAFIPLRQETEPSAKQIREELEARFPGGSVTTQELIMALREIAPGSLLPYRAWRAGKYLSVDRPAIGVEKERQEAAAARAEEEGRATATKVEEDGHPVEGKIVEEDRLHAARAQEEGPETVAKPKEEGRPVEGEIAEKDTSDVARTEEDVRPGAARAEEEGQATATTAEEEGRPVEGEIAEDDTLLAIMAQKEGSAAVAKSKEEGRPVEGEIADKDTSDVARTEEDERPGAARAEEEGRATENGAEEEEHVVVGDIAEEDALHKVIWDNDWESTKTLIVKQPNALKSRITASGKTPFHVAALFGHVRIMKELVKQLESPDFLETLDDFGNTPLLIATVNGSIEVADCLVEKNPKLLTIPNSTVELPATLAFLSGHHEMGRHLYYKTPLECLKSHNDGPLGPTLLRCCFQTQCLDIVRHLLSRCQELLFASDDKDWKPIYGIATMNSTIPSSSELVFWKLWIYDNIYTNSTQSFGTAFLPIQQHEGTRATSLGKLTRPVAAGHPLLQCLISSVNKWIGIKEIKDLKSLQAQAYEIVQLACKNARKKDQVTSFADALFCATKEGNVDFVLQISKANPEILLIGDNSYRNIFYHAIEQRQATFFNLIHGLRFKDVVASSRDRYGNSLLHAAAGIAPSTHLNRIYGPTLQMQNELQWFKEVEKLIPPTIKKAQNDFGVTAEELFKQAHEGLMKQGEEWIKATAQSCSVVGALLVTIIFAAAFTVPGGYDQTSGFPLLIKQSFFKVFIFSTMLSFIFSSTSVLIFLTILTSHYSQEKFLISLPTKLILGLLSLFFSIVSMMVAFLSTIHLMLKHTNYSWGLLPIIMLASVPISVFVLLQLPLLYHAVFATCGSIFNKKAEKWP